MTFVQTSPVRQNRIDILTPQHSGGNRFLTPVPAQSAPEHRRIKTYTCPPVRPGADESTFLPPSDDCRAADKMSPA